jgi:hypothetical protein
MCLGKSLDIELGDQDKQANPFGRFQPNVAKVRSRPVEAVHGDHHWGIGPGGLRTEIEDRMEPLDPAA